MNWYQSGTHRQLAAKESNEWNVLMFDEMGIIDQSLKGHRHDWCCLFTISFFPKLFDISSMKPSQNKSTIFKLIVHGIELHAAFEERENKQKNAKFWFKVFRVIFLFPQKCISDALFWGKLKKDNSKSCNVYKHKRLVTVFTNKDFYEWFQLCLLFYPFQKCLYIFDDFL